MQFLKEELRVKILESATDEFYEKGYSKASMRTIAKHSGITVGNIYRYFDGKEALFDAVVKGGVDQFFDIVKEADDLIKKNDEDLFKCFRETLIASLIKCVIETKTVMLILFRGAEGTKYGNFREDFKDVIFRKLMMHFNNNFKTDLKKERLEFISNVIASSCMEGFVEAILTYKDPKELKESMELIYDYHFLNFDERFSQLSKR